MIRLVDQTFPPLYSFFNEALRNGEQGYVPTETDILPANSETEKHRDNRDLF
jgi:hypothetical protein